MALALLAAAGWWVVREPLVMRPVAQPPAIDIDLPDIRARREAAVAIATMPDDPWSFAESLAASAPAGTSDKKEDCGLDDAPRAAEVDASNGHALPSARASPRYVAAQARIEAALRSSSDPLERAVADLINVGDMRTDAGRDDAVVQQAVATTDARLYALAYGICQTTPVSLPACRAMTLERWTQVDRGNGVPWVSLLSQASARGDAAGVQSALAHLATATRFDSHLMAAPGAVASHLPDDNRDLAAAHELTFKALSRAATQPLPPFQALMQACRDPAAGDDERVQSCRQISDVMFEHSDNLMSEAISGALLWQATGDPSRRDFIRAERAVSTAQWSPATGFSECKVIRDSISRLVRFGQVGQVEAMREQARKFVTP